MLWFITSSGSFLSSAYAYFLLSYSIFLLDIWHSEMVLPLLLTYFLVLLLMRCFSATASWAFLGVYSVISRVIVLYILRELFFVSIFIFFNQVTGIICNFPNYDVLPVSFYKGFLAFWIIIRQTDKPSSTTPFRTPKPLLQVVVLVALHPNSRWRQQVDHQWSPCRIHLQSPPLVLHRSCPHQTQWEVWGSAGG